MLKVNIEQALRLMGSGGVIAYPTEGLYGLGCDPFHRAAVEHLLCIKDRDESQGLIVLINSFQQLLELVNLPPRFDLNHVMDTWPGPTTWVFPAASSVPKWIKGQHNTVAIRMSAHPTASALCKNGPIVSTSANISGQPTLATVDDIQQTFGQLIEGVIEAPLGELKKATPIYSVTDKACLRA